MQIVHDEAVQDRYPTNFTASLAVREPLEASTFVDATKKCLGEVDANHLNGTVAASVDRWREIYRRMGAKPKYKSSLESLRDRLVEEDSLGTIHPVVDFYNAYSLWSALPMAGYDLSCIKGILRLRIADKGMAFQPLGKPNENSPTKANEVVYVDDDRVICRYWNLKDCDATKIQDSTVETLFIFDIVTDQGGDSAQEQASSLQQSFASLLGVTSTVGVAGPGLRTTIDV